MPKDISKIIEQEYKLGFQTDIEEEQAPPLGLNEDIK